MEREKIAIYGLGNFYKCNEDFLEGQFDIVFYIDRDKTGSYKGKPVYDPYTFGTKNISKIIIMLSRFNEALEVARLLHTESGISHECIKFGLDLAEKGSCREFGFDGIKFTEDGNAKVQMNGFPCIVSSLDEYNNVQEVLVRGIYNYSINNHRKDIIFDIGMNIGDSVHYFLEKDRVEKIYAFEPFYETFNKAMKNLKKDMGKYPQRIECFQIGLSNVTEKRSVSYNTGMSCGMSTINSITRKVTKDYYEKGYINDSAQNETVMVKCASEVLRPLIEQYPDHNIILKMDCEGEEYPIMEDLDKSGLLGSFSLIMMEWHYSGKESLLEKLARHGFSYFCSDENKDMGAINAFKPV
ncbi:MAG: FkbM family methyltransferase [Lachnospiraceae bacterium]|nr:FkbM family methyltransferase [Lachnospiraceae bacterium]